MQHIDLTWIGALAQSLVDSLVTLVLDTVFPRISARGAYSRGGLNKKLLGLTVCSLTQHLIQEKIKQDETE